MCNEAVLDMSFNLYLLGFLLIAGQLAQDKKPSQLIRKENANFRTNKKKNEKIWILKTVYGKH